VLKLVTSLHQFNVWTLLPDLPGELELFLLVWLLHHLLLQILWKWIMMLLLPGAITLGIAAAAISTMLIEKSCLSLTTITIVPPMRKDLLSQTTLPLTLIWFGLVILKTIGPNGSVTLVMLPTFLA
jgi:hypothetical protein